MSKIYVPAILFKEREEGVLVSGSKRDANKKVRENAITLKYLMDNFSAPLFGFIKRIILDHDRAEEILQISITRAYSEIDSYDGNKSRLLVWVLNIARDIIEEFTYPAKNTDHLLYKYKIIWELWFVRKHNPIEIAALLKLDVRIVNARIESTCTQMSECQKV